MRPLIAYCCLIALAASAEAAAASERLEAELEGRLAAALGEVSELETLVGFGAFGWVAG